MGKGRQGIDKPALCFSRLVNYYEGQWVLALVVGARFDAVRAIIGSSKPDQLKEGDIRKAILDKYGDSSISLIEDWTNGVDNGIHASDSVEAANQELKLWFDRPVPPTPKFLNLSSHAAGAENDDNFHPFAGLTLPIGDWTKCAEVVVDFFEGLPWLPGWVRGKNTPPMIISGTAVLVALVLYTYRALIGKDPTIQGANPFGEDDFLPEEQRLILSRLVEDLRRRRPALANPKAPGYNSYAWTTPEDR
jgi:nucleoside diphosphate kinase